MLASVWTWGFTIRKILQIKKANKICDSLEHTLLRSTSLDAFISSSMSMRDDLTIEINSTISTLLEKNACVKIKSCVDHILYMKTNEIRSGIDTLASIGSISPFIGLLGTVWGIMSSFRSMTGDASNMASIAPGIAESLLATAVGLIVAIPANIAYNKISYNIDKVEERYCMILNKIQELVA